MTSYNYLVDNVNKRRETEDLVADLLTRLSLAHLEHEHIIYVLDVINKLSALRFNKFFTFNSAAKTIFIVSFVPIFETETF